MRAVAIVYLVRIRALLVEDLDNVLSKGLIAKDNRIPLVGQEGAVVRDAARLCPRRCRDQGSRGLCQRPPSPRHAQAQRQ